MTDSETPRISNDHVAAGASSLHILN